MSRLRQLVVLLAIALATPGVVIAQTQSQDSVDKSEIDPLTALPEARSGLDAPINPDTYIVGPSDEFVLFLRGQANSEIRLRVLPEGTVMLPNVGPFPAAGLTITDFRNQLRKKLAAYYRNIDVECQLAQPRTFIVYVLGEVADPGAVMMRAPFKLESALGAAGGFAKFGSRRKVEVREKEKVVRTVDVDRFRLLGDTDQNPVLTEGQTVFVPPRGSYATVIGEVYRPGQYELVAGESLEDLVAMAGGRRSSAITDHVLLERQDRGENVSIERIPEDRFDSVQLTDLDVVVIPEVTSYVSPDYVMVFGGGGREGKFLIEEGEQLEAFVGRMVRYAESHDVTRAVIERANTEGEIRYIAVDLTDAFAGKPTGITLQHGDIINVPTTDASVYVTGEVTSPGEYPFLNGVPASRYISIAGGPREAGSSTSYYIFAVNGERRTGDRNSVVYRGETIMVRRKTSRVLSSVFFGLTSLTSLVLSIIAVSK